jgi:hypothetical protein
MKVTNRDLRTKLILTSMNESAFGLFYHLFPFV